MLFPLGAISMGQALKDDRCAATASMAENMAIAMPSGLGLRQDPLVQAAFNPLNVSNAVYVDPYGAIQGLGVLGTTIPRVAPSYVMTSPNPQGITDRLFCLPDDITFYENGQPDTSPGFVQRGLRYSYAYLLVKPQPQTGNVLQLNVVVYSGRPVGALTQEQTCTVPNYLVASAAPNGLSIISAGGPLPSIKFGSWILDTTLGNTPTFYRVVNVVDAGPISMTLEVQPNFGPNVNPITSITIMDSVAEVFDKGTGWLP